MAYYSSPPNYNLDEARHVFTYLNTTDLRKDTNPNSFIGGLGTIIDGLRDNQERFNWMIGLDDTFIQSFEKSWSSTLVGQLFNIFITNLSQVVPANEWNGFSPGARYEKIIQYIAQYSKNPYMNPFSFILAHNYDPQRQQRQQPHYPSLAPTQTHNLDEVLRVFTWIVAEIQKRYANGFDTVQHLFLALMAVLPSLQASKDSIPMTAYSRDAFTQYPFISNLLIRVEYIIKHQDASLWNNMDPEQRLNTIIQYLSTLSKQDTNLAESLGWRIQHGMEAYNFRTSAQSRLIQKQSSGYQGGKPSRKPRTGTASKTASKTTKRKASNKKSTKK
jgi:hypothetical protein